jgi:hypothetical protein
MTEAPIAHWRSGEYRETLVIQGWHAGALQRARWTPIKCDPVEAWTFDH